MQAFRATYKPRMYRDDGSYNGHNDEKAEAVLVIAFCPAPSPDYNQDRVAIIRGDSKNSLDIVEIDCITECVAQEILL